MHGQQFAERQPFLRITPFGAADFVGLVAGHAASHQASGTSF